MFELIVITSSKYVTASVRSVILLQYTAHIKVSSFVKRTNERLNQIESNPAYIPSLMCLTARAGFEACITDRITATPSEPYPTGS